MTVTTAFAMWATALSCMKLPYVCSPDSLNSRNLLPPQDKTQNPLLMHTKLQGNAKELHELSKP